MENQPDKFQRAVRRVINHVDKHRGKYSAITTAVVIGAPAYFKIKLDARVINALGGNEPAGYFVDLPLNK